MVGGFFLYGLVDKDPLRCANDKLRTRCDELWVFGVPSDGVVGELRWAMDNGTPVRYFRLDHYDEAIEEVPDLAAIAQFAGGACAHCGYLPIAASPSRALGNSGAHFVRLLKRALETRSERVSDVVLSPITSASAPGARRKCFRPAARASAFA